MGRLAFLTVLQGFLLGRAAQAPGEELARKVCASCHLFPEPEILDRKSWRDQILPRMETRLGVSPPDYSSSPDGELLRSLHIYPDEPALGKSDWNQIVDYYLAQAPTNALPQAPHAEITVGLKQFSVTPSRVRHNPPLTTMVKVGAKPGRIYAGDDHAQSIALLDGKGDFVQALNLQNVPIGLLETNSDLWVTAIGSIVPTERQQGALLRFPGSSNTFSAPEIVLKDLPRTTQMEFCDFNGDGKMDFALAMFGNQRGRFSWFENLGNGQYEEHVLYAKAGAIHFVVHDFNGDGLPDLALLIAQDTEAFFIYTNTGKGDFSSHLIFQKQPAYGHNYFELADFDGDGRMDLLVVNGDNGEYESPTKNYHGVRILLNRGLYKYEEAYFFPLNGATKAVARDFDGDGDLDVAVISFFPDYEKSPRESFVYLENQGGLKFAPSTFRECIVGRWVVMDVGDVDGDGDLDIVLGSYIRGPTAVPAFLKDLWEKQGPSVIILKNNLHHP